MTFNDIIYFIDTSGFLVGTDFSRYSRSSAVGGSSLITLLRIFSKFRNVLMHLIIDVIYSY